MDPTLTLLVGAGCSPALPKARDVVTPLLSSVLGREPTEDEKSIRFEHLMQIVRDYLDPDLRFLQEIYLRRLPIHPYAQLFASLARLPRCNLFTTNFDLQIERADLVPFKRIASVVTEEEYRRAARTLRTPRVHKLHGSADRASTLAATFDTTGEVHGTGARFAAFSTAIASADLCVIGYAGYDDMDVVPTIVRTPAHERELHWFHHMEGIEPFVVRSDDLLSDPDAVDPLINGQHRPVLQVLRALRQSGNRNPEKVMIHCGATEQTVPLFFSNYRLPTTTRRCLRKLSRSPARTAAAEPALLARSVLRRWFSSLPARRKILGACVAADAVHTQSQESNSNIELIQRLRAAIASLASPSSSAPDAINNVLLLGSLAPLLYWQADENEVSREELGTVTAIAGNLAQGFIDAQLKGTADVPASHVASSVSQIFVWHAESQRMAGNFSASRAALQHPFAFDPEGLARSLQGSPAFRTQVPSPKEGATALAFAKASWKTTLGDLLLSHERNHEGLDALSQARSELRRIGNSYWAINAEVSMLGALCSVGRVSEAISLGRDVLVSNAMSGWTGWFETYALLYMADLARVQHPCDDKIDDARAIVARSMSYTDDGIATEAGKVIDWALRCARSDALLSLHNLQREYTNLRSDSVLEEEDNLKVDPLYAELLLRAGADDQALDFLLSLRAKVRSIDAPLTRLKLMLLRQSVKIRSGGKASWKPLWRCCRAREFEIGAAWAACAGILSGDDIEIDVVDWLRSWAAMNGVVPMQDILQSRDLASARRTFLPTFAIGWA